MRLRRILGKNIKEEKKVRTNSCKWENIYIVGSLKNFISVNRNISAEELREKFKGYRQPPLEVFEDVLDIMSLYPIAALIVNDSDRFNPPLESIGENIYRNMDRTYMEFWI